MYSVGKVVLPKRGNLCLSYSVGMWDGRETCDLEKGDGLQPQRPCSVTQLRELVTGSRDLVSFQERHLK